MPDSGTSATPPPPAIHPMDPRRGENLSPRFAAVLAWLLQTPPMTTPAITGIVVSGTGRGHDRAAPRYGRYGYRRVAALLRDASWQANDKRVERLWRREGPKVPGKQPKRGRLWLNDGS